MKKTILIVLSWFALSMPITIANTLTSTPSYEKAIFDILNYQTVLEVDLTFDWEKTMQDRRNMESHKAILSFLDKKGKYQEWNVNLSLRGKFRRMHCEEMPPLKIDFSKKDLKAAGLAPFDDLKMVNYCMGDNKTAKEALLKEYLTYKLYNQITEKSFRVQLLKINFKDLRTGETQTQFAFLIEDTAQLRTRIEAEKVDSMFITDKELFHPHYSKTAALFQYMIGNTDWQMGFSKNVKFLKKDKQVIPVPYDFDFSAIVAASYSKREKGVTGAPGRVYKGLDEEHEALEAVIEVFTEKRPALLDTIQSFKLLNAGSRKKMIKYLNDFFENIEEIELDHQNKAL